MKVIIAGSRGITDYQLLLQAIGESGFFISEVVSGGARGVDALGERFARDCRLKLRVMRADWSQGRGAGHARNKRMAGYGEGLIALWDGKSPGTASMIRYAEERGLKVHVKIVN